MDEANLGIDAMRGGDPGGHFGSGHMIAHYQTAFYRLLLSDYREAREAAGSMAASRREALDEHVERRRREIEFDGLGCEWAGLGRNTAIICSHNGAIRGVVVR